jgi:hypothetical protein
MPHGFSIELAGNISKIHVLSNQVTPSFDCDRVVV